MKVLPLIFAALLLSSSKAQEEMSKIELEVEKNLVSGLMSPQVQDQLELIAEQKKEITSLSDALKLRHVELREQMQQFQESGVTVEQVKEKQAELQALLDVEKESAKEALLGALLPHQQQRLKETLAQILVQQAARKEKVASSLLVPDVRELLEVSPEQAKRIKAKSKKLQKEIAEKLAKLQQEARQEILQELDDKQKAKYKRLFGEHASTLPREAFVD